MLLRISTQLFCECRAAGATAALLRNTPKRTTPAQQAEVRRLRAAGASFEDIRCATGVGKTTAYRVVAKQRQGNKGIRRPFDLSQKLYLTKYHLAFSVTQTNLSPRFRKCLRPNH